MSFYFLVVLFVTFAASGLQYSVLGSVWPIVYRDFGVALSLVGYINMIIAAGRVTASIFTDRLVGRYGTYRVAACGFGLICLGLFGYANCGSYAVLCLSSIPLGIGEDLFLCTINTFSALHLRAKYANWLNMVWSLGATAGPYIMSLCLKQGRRMERRLFCPGGPPVRCVAAVFILPRPVAGNPIRQGQPHGDEKKAHAGGDPPERYACDACGAVLLYSD